MSNINENFLKLENNYLFVTIADKVKEYEKKNPGKKIIKLGIGDITRPIPKTIVEAMIKAVNEMGDNELFRGYGPELGYNFLKEKIKEEYERRNIKFELDEIFISDGIAADIGNFSELFSENNKVAITDPIYPEYLDVNVISGRTGKINEDGKSEGVYYMPIIEENNFEPELPKEKVDFIYLCFPNNPTGTVLNKQQLKKWIDYANENNSIIFYDAAYEGFITTQDIPHSIYEIEGAKKCCVEFKSFSKTAGFTGVRCGYTIVPKELYGVTSKNEKVSINEIWARRQSTKTNGVSYITQRGAEAAFTEEGKKEIKENIGYYMKNAKMLKEEFENIGFKVYGGENAPYVWLKIPEGKKSWDFFDELLDNVGVVGTPGVGFGPSGEGYFRLTAFGTKENTKEAIERIKKYYDNKNIS